jgi:hypothetical protein
MPSKSEVVSSSRNGRRKKLSKRAEDSMPGFGDDDARQPADDDQEEVEMHLAGIPEGYRVFARAKGGKLVGPFSVVGPDGPLGSFDSQAGAVAAAIDDCSPGLSYP